MKISRFVLGAALGVMLASGAALAQDAAAPAPAAAPRAAGQPEVKTIGDWIVRCFPVTSPSPCDMYQELDDPRSRQRVLSLSIAFVPSLDRHGIQVTVPLEVGLQKGLTIKTDTYNSPVLKFRRCDRQGCYVEMAMDNAAIASLGKSSGNANVKIFADNGKPYDLRFSLKGFSGAHDSMVEQARAKAKAVSPTPPAAAPKP